MIVEEAWHHSTRGVPIHDEMFVMFGYFQWVTKYSLSPKIFLCKILKSPACMEFVTVWLDQIILQSIMFAGAAQYATVICVHGEDMKSSIRVFHSLYKVGRNGNFEFKGFNNSKKKSYLQWGST